MPIPLRMGISDPSKHKKQFEFLTMDRCSAGVHSSHYVGGRGCAKTTTGVLIAGMAAMIWSPGVPGMVTEPTYRHLYDVFLREWARVWPAELWRFEKKLERIIINHTGGSIDLRSRNVDNPQKEMGKGPNLGWIVDDEAAYRFSLKRWQDEHAAIRHPDAPFRFHVTLSTPKMNDYHRLCHTTGHAMVRASSYDNPYLPTTFAADLESTMSPDYARQEIYGDWISLYGRIWRGWITEDWPAGNMWVGGHDQSNPWELWCDLGIQSSWLAVQTRQTSAGYPVRVITHEWQPNQEGAAQTIERIDQALGCPSRVIVGADVNTRSTANADRPIYYFRQKWGSAVFVLPVTGDIADKGLQHMQASAMILNGKNQRRLCLASDVVSHDEENGRTFLETMEQDSWGDNPRVGEFMPKTKGRSDLPNTEDTRDAFLYGCVVVNPPSMDRSITGVAV